jgi:hypothetical protein
MDFTLLYRMYKQTIKGSWLARQCNVDTNFADPGCLYRIPDPKFFTLDADPHKKI